RAIPAPGEDRLAVGAERHGTHLAGVLEDRVEAPAGGRVPEPRRAVIAAGDDELAVGAEGRIVGRTRVREDGLELGVIVKPGGRVGPGSVLPGRVASGDRRTPALDHPEQARTNLLLLEGSLAA